MHQKKEHHFGLKSFFSHPFFDEDFWQIETKSQTGLSIYEDELHFVIEAQLPGLKLEEIEISFEKGNVWIKGEKQKEEEDKNRKYYKKAVSAFSYHVHIPEKIDEKKEPVATFKEGLLKIQFFKAPQSGAKKISIRAH